MNSGSAWSEILEHIGYLGEKKVYGSGVGQLRLDELEGCLGLKSDRISLAVEFS
jgi:hypothetical protein